MNEEPQRHDFKFTVENLGRIARAEVELKPLTLFVGENNSGKSYLATAAWAMHLAPPAIFEDRKTALWQELEDAVQEAVKRSTSKPTRLDHLMESGFADLVGLIDPELLVRVWNAHSHDAIRVLLREAFRADLFGNPVFSFGSSSGHVAVVWMADGPHLFGSRLAGGWRSISSILDDTTPANLAQRVLQLHSPFPTGGARGDVSTALTQPSHRSSYFPASRTGFLQILPDLVDSLIGHGASGNGRLLPDVTAPVVQFLRSMLRRTNENGGRFTDLASFIEHSALGGAIQTDSGAIGRILYRPKGSDILLPMGRASAVVSEFAPLVTMLRTWEIAPRFLVYEEPEAHLHPRLQRVMAQVLVRLVRRGTKVLVTTHSDTFVQQINNLIKRGELGVPASPSYSDEDFLLADEVAAYEFRFRDDGRTEVDRLETRRDGVVYPMFNHELARMTEEALALDEQLENG